MRSPAIVAAAVIVLSGSVPRTSAAETATATLTATAQLNSRTSLVVSTKTLRFDVTAPDQPAVASVEFVAGVRTIAASQVMLTVEPLRGIGPGGAADIETIVSFSGEGEGTASGVLVAARPAVAGTWTGSGRRTGRLVFSLRSAATGSYTLPLRFVLSAP